MQKRKLVDDEFMADNESSTDDEATLAREEEMEEGEATADSHKELCDLEAENDMPLEELVKKYAGAYDSDFEQNLPSDGSAADETSDDDGTKEKAFEARYPLKEAQEIRAKMPLIGP